MDMSWVNSRSWWWTGRPDVLRFTGTQRVGHDWVTELNWNESPFQTEMFSMSVNQDRLKELIIQVVSYRHYPQILWSTWTVRTVSYSYSVLVARTSRDSSGRREKRPETEQVWRRRDLQTRAHGSPQTTETRAPRAQTGAERQPWEWEREINRTELFSVAQAVGCKEERNLWEAENRQIHMNHLDSYEIFIWNAFCSLGKTKLILVLHS